MLRLLAFLAVIGLLVAGAVWLADRPGAVSVEWQGWRLDTSVPVLLLALFLVFLALAVLVRLLRFLLRAPGRIAARRREGRRKRGYGALVDGLAAVAAGDAQQARRHARRADALLADPALTALLDAQAAQLAGDGEAARRHFTALLDRPETALAGLRGLLAQALAAGDAAAALDYAKRAHDRAPEATDLAATLLDLQARAGLWRDAQDTLVVAARAMPPDEARRKRAVILLARSQAEGDAKEAAKLAKQAHESDPGFVPASVRLARLYAEAGKRRKAAGVIEDGWRAEPHPDLLAAWLDIMGGAEPLERVRAVERLAARNPDHPASHLALGQVSLAARLWGQARHHLTAAVAARPSAGAYRLLAELEEGEHGDGAAARDWLRKAAEAPADAAWRCRRCTAAPPEWSALCPSCGQWDAIAWNSPARLPALAAAPAG